jgi:hypothetical protein
VTMVQMVKVKLTAVVVEAANFTLTLAAGLD